MLRNCACLSLVVASFVAVACGSSSGGSGPGLGGNASAQGGGINVSSGGSSSTAGKGNGSGGLDPNSACIGTSVEGERVPVDLYFMVDTTGSMNCPVPDSLDDPCTVDPGPPYAATTRWVVESAALKSFMESPKNNGMGVGIGFFPASRDACNANTYKQPAVEVAMLPGAASQLTAAIAAKKPAGTTPTVASLTGAIQHASDYAKAHVGHRVAVVYSTDGYPVGCGGENNISNATKVASSAFAGNPSIPVYVLAVGNNLDALNDVAAAGGTDKAYHIDTSRDAAAAQLSQALDSIRGRALVGCTYEIPSPPTGQQIDYGLVNVRVTAGDGKMTQVYRDPSPTACNQGWQYSADKTQINLCGSVCEQVKNDPNMKLEVLFGCTTQVIPE
ncbi:MAG: hypothetical protein ACOY0T_11010 [Myxococcota bacterium]